MSYSNFLSKAIKETGYSQQQIATLAKTKYNTDIDPSYISKLQSGKKIASNEINEVLAKVCKILPEDLQFEADFERTPKNVQKSIYDMIDILKKMFIKTFEAKSNDKDLYLQAMNSLSTRQFVDLMASSDFSNFDSEEFNPFNKEITSEKILNRNDILNNLSMEIAMNYKMNDGSMSPLIQQGAKLVLTEITDIKNGDVVLAEDTKQNLFVRFYNKTYETISLLPVNNNFETIQYKENEYVIRAKVTGYIVNFN